MTKRRVENPVCANGLKGGPACGTLHVQIMGHVASMRCHVVNDRDCPPKARRAVDAASNARLAGVMGDGVWLLSSSEGACFSHCARALARKHGKENRLTRSLLERQCIVPLLHISGPLGQENTARQMPFTSRSAHPMSVGTRALCLNTLVEQWRNDPHCHGCIIPGVRH